MREASDLKKSLTKLAVEAEPLQPDQEKAKTNLDAAKQAKLDEMLRLREAARRQLDLMPAPDKLMKVVAGTAVSIIVIAGAGTVYYLNEQPADSAQVMAASIPQPQQGAAGSIGMQGSVANQVAALPSQTLTAPKINEDLSAKPAQNAPTEAVAKSSQVTNKPEQEQLDKLAAISSPAQIDKDKEPAAYIFQVPSLSSVKAMRAIEDVQQLQPQFGAASSVFYSDREHLKQALERNDRPFVKELIESSGKPYSRSLLLLEQIQLQNEQQPQQAREALDSMRKVLAETRDIDQQVLILGALNKGYLILHEPAKAESSFKQAIAKVSDVPKRSFQALSLLQLANEQALLGNVATTQKLLKMTEPLLESTLADNPKAAKLSQVIAIYALVADFDAAKSRLADIQDPAKREALNLLVSDLETKTH